MYISWFWNIQHVVNCDSNIKRQANQARVVFFFHHQHSTLVPKLDLNPFKFRLREERVSTQRENKVALTPGFHSARAVELSLWRLTSLLTGQSDGFPLTVAGWPDSPARTPLTHSPKPPIQASTDALWFERCGDEIRTVSLSQRRLKGRRTESWELLRTLTGFPSKHLASVRHIYSQKRQKNMASLSTTIPQ